MSRHRISLDGVLLLDKPSGMTSNAALQQAKRLFRAAKAGHGGTLDPMATGLLPVCFGEATKFVSALIDARKAYQAVVRFGVRTTTGDGEGAVVERRQVLVTRPQLEAAVGSFVGKIRQVPPMYSALKRNGRPLYSYARQGLEVEREPREVEIHRLAIEAFDGECATLIVECSKGTYVRTLAEDLGRALGCGGHLQALRRTAVGPFSLDQAVTLAQLEALSENQREARLLPADALVAALPRLELAWADERALCLGQAIAAPAGTATGLLRLYARNGRFLGLGEHGGDGLVRPRRLLRADLQAGGGGAGYSPKHQGVT